MLAKQLDIDLEEQGWAANQTATLFGDQGMAINNQHKQPVMAKL
jgi:hypothetical protein